MRQLEKYIKVELINHFDVWGNRKDGYEVNNSCTEGEFYILEDSTNRDILSFLKEVNFFQKHVRMNMVNFVDAYMDCWFIEDRHGLPICTINILESGIV